MERTDWLKEGMPLTQDTDLFCYGTDTVALANFASVHSGERIVDLCAGNGALTLLMAAKSPTVQVTGVELLERSHALAEKNIAQNHMQDRVTCLQGDIREIRSLLPHAGADVVVCNPPYMPVGSGRLNPTDEKAISRHELCATITHVTQAAGYLLRYGGRLYLVHRCDRLCDVLCAMREAGIEPKQLRFLHPTPGKAPNLFLVSGTVGGKPSMVIQDPLYLNSLQKEE
ncbi:MAG: tRNA1(Val) (adenine(37)-N6)-methyltransferase [Ruminococcaceae bacterium]|nr:tRNA1(Val) (adenine(37)-N6)-methyltransferase [Oscillospiraceae bacterium]